MDLQKYLESFDPDTDEALDRLYTYPDFMKRFFPNMPVWPEEEPVRRDTTSAPSPNYFTSNHT